jgi:hypothetical protein
VLVEDLQKVVDIAACEVASHGGTICDAGRGCEGVNQLQDQVTLVENRLNCHLDLELVSCFQTNFESLFHTFLHHGRNKIRPSIQIFEV